MLKWFVHLLTAGLLVGAATTAALADPVTITFDQPPCAPNARGAFPRDCYRAAGFFVSSGQRDFSLAAGEFAIVADPRAVSRPNVARPLSGFDSLGFGFVSNGTCFNPLNLFHQPGCSASAVSFHITGSGPGQTPWRVQILGLESRLEDVSGVSDEVVSFSSPHNPIVSLAILMGSPARGIDNVSFTSPADLAATPEPSTLLLIATGSAVLRRPWRRGSTTHRASTSLAVAS
ncbi:MAG: hypothetical protein DMG04_06015 [Acidobacteria bacterium]|nr:MAG: hypothetical protein DMG04_06015 [Acidobacteriota bacterium]PYQ90268.1 MAG: hypothetical protein DMG03_00815 [Acidobacteriota bacterium]PYQ92201.1 MAG: hypothetical protein DMG02_02015 [Acidobacteriota bacterium]PYR10899.1 MAG: hypothetical protein DMF99_10185 [Acidobacteriota bacterium]